MFMKSGFAILTVAAIAVPAIGSSDALAQGQRYVSFECDETVRPQIFVSNGCPHRRELRRRVLLLPPPPPQTPPPPRTPDDPQQIFSILTLDSGGGDGGGGGGGR